MSKCGKASLRRWDLSQGDREGGKAWRQQLEPRYGPEGALRGERGAGKAGTKGHERGSGGVGKGWRRPSVPGDGVPEPCSGIREILRAVGAVKGVKERGHSLGGGAWRRSQHKFRNR